MLFLLSPAKTLDYDTPVRAAVAKKATDPLFADRAADLVGVLQHKTPAEVAELMDLSDGLAALNVGRYAAWQREATPDNSKPAALAFNGDVYEGLDANTLSTADLVWAQAHVVILSGLYGVLRPLDRLQPYRLEMGTALANPHGKDLYAFWGDTVAQHLNERLAQDKMPIVVNLASQEYARAALRPALQARVVDCQFEDWKGGQYKIISFFAKRARGLMARWAIEHKARTPQALRAFDAEGYALDAGASTHDRLVFRRRVTG
jgi:cytoplasmic iron level regulating protein YaaA (DUF328/UPF0246 family)